MARRVGALLLPELVESGRPVIRGDSYVRVSTRTACFFYSSYSPWCGEVFIKQALYIGHKQAIRSTT